MDTASRRHRTALDRASFSRDRSLSTSTATIVDRLRELALIGATPAGIDRRLFSRDDARARQLFARWAREAGLAVTQDLAGNVFARRTGRDDLAPILTGSHLDTVPTGGAYDGAYGAVAAICALQMLTADGYVANHPLEAVAWAGEEGSRFPLGCLGSAAYAGLNDFAQIDALLDADGISFAQARASSDGLLEGIPMRERSQYPVGYVELHIEQGPVLEQRGARLGNVTAIAGQARFEIVVSGTSGHAGTVPMAMRHDALSAAAEILLALEAEARTTDDAVLTVGRLMVEPNQTNVIPACVRFRVDARSIDEERLAKLRMSIVDRSMQIAKARGVHIMTTLIEERRAVAMNPGLRRALASGLATLNVPVLDLPSGAGHDAMCVAAVAPAAMIFVPSAGGLSHVGEEYTAPADLALGVEALARSIAAIDRYLSKEK